MQDKQNIHPLLGIILSLGNGNILCWGVGFGVRVYNFSNFFGYGND